MKKVTFIDSGIGGMSTMGEFSKLSEGCEITYIADNAHVPYGNKSHEQITVLVEKIFNRFVDYDTDVVCIACNTMTSCVLESLQIKYPLKIFGVTPNFSEPIAKGKKNIMLLGTERMIKENIEQYRKKKLIINPQHDLARTIETNIFNEEIIRDKIEQISDETEQFKLEAVILGCTHYSLVKNIFQSVFPKHISFYDNNIQVAKEIVTFLNVSNLNGCGQNNQYKLQLTDKSDVEVEKYLKLIKNIV